MKKIRVALLILCALIHRPALAGKTDHQSDDVTTSDVLSKVQNVLRQLDKNKIDNKPIIERFESGQLNETDQTDLILLTILINFEKDKFKEHCRQQVCRVKFDIRHPGRTPSEHYEQCLEQGKDHEKEKINMFVKTLTHPKSGKYYTYLPTSWWCHDID